MFCYSNHSSALERALIAIIICLKSIYFEFSDPLSNAEKVYMKHESQYTYF